MHDPLEKHAPDRPMFAPDAFRLSPSQAELIAKAQEFGRGVLAPRAQKYDREASFPIENFRDMRREGLLGICIPKEEGGLGADFATYCLAAAELGRACLLDAVVGRTC
jgi:alkylation response protein AidB-like acyl-CoA dehydrogenase